MGDRNPGCELGENKRNDYDFFRKKILHCYFVDGS